MGQSKRLKKAYVNLAKSTFRAYLNPNKKKGSKKNKKKEGGGPRVETAYVISSDIEMLKKYAEAPRRSINQ